MALSAGYNTVIKIAGTSTAFTAEACSLVSGNIYQITDATKRIWDGNVAVTVYENAIVSVLAYTLDYNFGKITFPSPPTTPITVTGSYYPMWSITTASSATIEGTNGVANTTRYSDAGSATKTYTLQEASGKLSVFEDGLTDHDTGAGTVKLMTLLTGQTLKVLEINNGGANTYWRVRAALAKAVGKLPVGGVVETEFDWVAVGDGSAAPFGVGT